MSYGSIMSQSSIPTPFEEAVIRITGPSHGAIVTVIGGGISKTATEVSSGVWEVSVDKGTWTVSAGSLYTSSSVSATVPKIYSVVLSIAVSSTLNNNSWDTISNISKQGLASQYWSVGDRKSVILNGTVDLYTWSNETTWAFIIGINHNSSREGDNLIHFQLGKFSDVSRHIQCWADNNYYNGKRSSGFIMNTANEDKAGGWAQSYMRDTVCASFINCIESSLRDVLKPVIKYTDNRGIGRTSRSAVSSTSDKIFLCSPVELRGSNENYVNIYEQNYQEQYNYYKANSILAYTYENNSDSTRYWLRSPAYDYSSDEEPFTFNIVGSNTGSIIGFRWSNYSMGFAPCFCV